MPLIATNDDSRMKVGQRFYPDSGPTLQAILTACNLSAGQFDLVGKPNPFAFEVIREEHGLSSDRTLMIGDRPNTDIVFGKAAGVDQCLVFSGVVKSF